MNPSDPDIKKAAVCGLFCPACSLYIATTEDPERLEILAKRFGMPKEELECLGCRSEKLSFFCRNHCKMVKCAAEKGLEFCCECGEYPCAELSVFQSKAPHRIELWNSQKRIKEAGWEKWYSEMLDMYKCGACGAISSAYDIKCRKCGEEPSCAFTAKYHGEIEKSISKMKP